MSQYCVVFHILKYFCFYICVLRSDTCEGDFNNIWEREKKKTFLFYTHFGIKKHLHKFDSLIKERNISIYISEWAAGCLALNAIKYFNEYSLRDLLISEDISKLQLTRVILTSWKMLHCEANQIILRLSMNY